MYWLISDTGESEPIWQDSQIENLTIFITGKIWYDSDSFDGFKLV